MSGVDVLAVLDDLIDDMGDLPGTTGHQVAKARAAVAELIEAAELARDYIEGLGVHLTDGAGKANLRAALARCGGGK